MDYDSVLNGNELADKCRELSNILKQEIAFYNYEIEAINLYIESDASGEAADKLRAKACELIQSLKLMILADEHDIRDFNLLSESVDGVNIDGYEVLTRMKEARRNADDCYRQAEEYYRSASSCPIGSIIDHYYDLSNSYKSYAESWDRIADTLHKIEVQYDDVDYRTSELFKKTNNTNDLSQKGNGVIYLSYPTALTNNIYNTISPIDSALYRYLNDVVMGNSTNTVELDEYLCELYSWFQNGFIDEITYHNLEKQIQEIVSTGDISKAHEIQKDINKINDWSFEVPMKLHSSELDNLNISNDYLNENQREVFIYCWNTLVDMGLTKGQIIAIMANMFQESRLSPTNYQGSVGNYNPDYWNNYNSTDGLGYGLFQWSYPLRKQQLKEFLDKNSSHPADDYCVQFDFFIWEITEGDYSDEWKKFLNSGSLEIGVDVFFNEIEQGSIEGPRKEIAEEIRSWYEMTFN